MPNRDEKGFDYNHNRQACAKDLFLSIMRQVGDETEEVLTKVFHYSYIDEGDEDESTDSLLRLKNPEGPLTKYSFHYCRISEVIQNTLNGIRSTDPKVPRSASTRLVKLPEELLLSFNKNSGAPIKVLMEEKIRFTNAGRQISATLCGFIQHTEGLFGGGGHNTV